MNAACMSCPKLFPRFVNEHLKKVHDLLPFNIHAASVRSLSFSGGQIAASAKRLLPDHQMGFSLSADGRLSTLIHRVMLL